MTEGKPHKDIVELIKNERNMKLKTLIGGVTGLVVLLMSSPYLDEIHNYISPTSLQIIGCSLMAYSLGHLDGYLGKKLEDQ